MCCECYYNLENRFKNLCMDRLQRIGNHCTSYCFLRGCPSSLWTKQRRFYYSCNLKDHDLTYGQQKQRVFLGILFLILIFILISMYLVGVTANDSPIINNFLLDLIHSWTHWYLLVIIIYALILTYILSLFSAGLCNAYSNELQLHLCHKVCILICLGVVTAGIAAISVFYPEIWLLLASSFDVTAIFLQLVSIILWTLFSFYIRFFIQQIESLPKRLVTYFVYIVVLVFLFTIFAWHSSPCIGSAPFVNSKPLLIGHRGAPTLGPENTIFSYQKTIASCDIFALESDVRISSDGIPFLMHDDKLLRTTDVREIFPLRKNENPENFSWQELQQLNAGQWFLNTDPFLTNGALTETDKKEIRKQKIPSLLEYLNLAAKYNLSIMFDLNQPPYGHAYRESYVNATLNVMLKSELPQAQVLWLNSPEHYELVKARAPGFRIVSPNPPDPKISNKKISLFNLLFSTVTQSMMSANHSIISYTVDSSWAFTRAWCQGSWAVTTNYCPVFSKVQSPSWRLTRPQYLGIWITLNLLCLLCAIVVLCIFGKKCRAATHNLNAHSLEVMEHYEERRVDGEICL